MHREVRNVRFEFPVDDEESTALCHFHLFGLEEESYVAIATDVPDENHGGSVSQTIADFATSVARDFFIDPKTLRVFAHYDDRGLPQALPGRIDGESFAEATFTWIEVFNPQAKIKLPKALDPVWSFSDRASVEKIIGRPLEYRCAKP